MTKLIDRRKTIASLLTILFVFSCTTMATAAPAPNSASATVEANLFDRHRDRDRDDDDDRWDRGDRAEARRRAHSFGMRAGIEQGRRDRFRREGFNFRDEAMYRNATLGYRRQFGSLEAYRRNFREGFAIGYSQGYRSGGSRW